MGRGRKGEKGKRGTAESEQVRKWESGNGAGYWTEASAQPSNMREDFFVGAGKGEFVKLTECEPLMGGVGMRVREAGPVDFEGDAVSSDGVFDDAKWLGGGAFEARPA